MTELATIGSDSGRSVAPSAERIEISFPRVLSLIRKRYRLFLSCVVVGLAVGIILALLPRVYETTGRMQVHPGSANMYKFDKSALLGGESTKLESGVEVLQSETLLLQVASELKLAENPDFMLSRPKGKVSLDDPEVSELVLKRFSRNLSVQLLPRTEIIAVTCTTRSAALSARIVNQLINDYIEHLFKTRFASTQRVAGWLSNQFSDLNREVQSEQEQLVELQKKLGVVGIDKNHNLVATGLEGLTKAAAEAKINRIVAEARYRTLTDSDPNLIEGSAGMLTSPLAPSNSQFSLLATLRAQRAQLATRFAEVSSQFGPNYSEYKEIKAQLDEATSAVAAEQARVLAQSKNAFAAAKSNENMTTAALEAQESDAFRMRDDVVRYDILQHLYESNRQLYQGLVQRLREASIVSGLESSEVDIVDLARIHSRPAGLGRLAKTSLGLMLGILLGMVAIIFSEALDTKIRTIGELEQNSGLPPLCFIPLFKSAEQVGLDKGQKQTASLFPEILRSPKSLFAESIFSLRSALLLSAIDRPPQVILIASAKAAEGKSTIAANLAIALSHLDAPTLLIDCDLRRPTIRSGFSLSKDGGLTSVLTGRMEMDEAIQTIPGAPSLSLLTSGPLPPSPADTLSSRRMADLVAEARNRYTYIILDCPPALMVTDAVILSRLADAVVLVARMGQVDRFGIKRLSEVFRQAKAPLVGIALNGVTHGSMGYGYDSYLYSSYEKG